MTNQINHTVLALATRLGARGVGWRRLAVVALIVGGPSTTAAQTSRVDQIADQQTAKASRLAPEGPPGGEVVVKRVMSSRLLTGAGGVYPWFGSVYTGTGFGTGVGALRRQARGGALSAVAAVGVTGSLRFDAEWDIPALTASEAIRPRLWASWIDAKGIGHYGVGMDSLEEGRTQFDYQPTDVGAALDASLGPWLEVTASYGYLGVSTERHGTDSAETPLVGIGESIRYGVAALGAALDWRTSPGYSTRGGLLRVDWRRYDASGDARFSFDRIEVEAVHLVPLLHEQYVLAFRALMTETRPLSGDVVPFVFLPSIGGGSTVRGLVNRRLHDRSRALVTAEYRWRPSRFLDMALFVDNGTVAPRAADIRWNDFTTAWGIGARLHGPAFTALRVDAARGREGWVFVFSGGQPF